MAGRPKPVKTWISPTGADQQIVSGFQGALYGVHLSWNNQTVGDRIIIHDSLTATGNKVFEFILPTTAGSYSPNLPAVGREFYVGLFLNGQLLATTNDKIKVEVDYDGV